MLRLTVLGPVALALVPSLAVQVPFGIGHLGQNGNKAIRSDEDLAEWNLNKLPNPNDTDHLVFETVHSLLQRWPNTRMRNGHNIVPGTIPKGTVLYHVKDYDGLGGLPQGPEWLATDPEHSRIFCVSPFTPSFQQTCTFLTLSTSRPLKVIYFDGNSAANTPNGTMDTLELLAWDRVVGGHFEREIISDLCKWGNKFGVDGFVRMEMDFEIILCDFTSGLRLVSSVNLMSRGAYHVFRPGFITFEVIKAGSWHNRFPGETRVQLDLAGLVSFYDTQLAPSLVPFRAGKERWFHRVQNASREDLLAVKTMLETALTRPSGKSSGIDWRTAIQVIVDRFAGRLELTRHLLNSSATDSNNFLDLAKEMQSQLRTMLTPYIHFSVTPTDKANLDWTIPIYKLCAMSHTHFMESELLSSMTDSEKLLLRAVRGTSQEICRVVSKMWAAGVYAGIDASLNRKEFPEITEVTQVWSTWRDDLDGLMNWLDWSVWVKCEPECGPEELCYLPTWPIALPKKNKGRKQPSPFTSNMPPEDSLNHFNLQSMIQEQYTELWNSLSAEGEAWLRPQPRCISGFGPQSFNDWPAPE